jgi:hypothetical protein
MRDVLWFQRPQFMYAEYSKTTVGAASPAGHSWSALLMSLAALVHMVAVVVFLLAVLSGGRSLQVLLCVLSGSPVCLCVSLCGGCLLR